MTVRLQSHRAANPSEGRRFQQVLFLCTLVSLTMVQMTLLMASNIISSLFPFDMSLPTRLPLVLAPMQHVRPVNSTSGVSVLPFRMLLGIFSHDTGGNGKLQRDLVRRTYLSLPLFLERFDITTIPLRHARICSLQDYTLKTIEQPEQCQILYTFVISGNSTDKHSPLEYLGSAISGRSLTIQVSDPEQDAIYLHKEANTDMRKTSSWLQYASTEVPTEINIVAKVDAESLVYPNVILEETEAAVTTPETLFVGGSRNPNNRNHDDVQGGVFFLSRHLAQRIYGNRQSNRWKVVQRFLNWHQSSEDIETGQWMKAFGTSEVTWLDIPHNVAWVDRKELKGKQGFLMKWDKYVMKMIAHDRLTKTEQMYGDCPEPHLHRGDSIFLDSIPMTEAKKMFSLMLAQKISSCKNISSISLKPTG